MKPLLSLAVLLALTVSSGIIHGRLTGRWGQAEILASAGKRLNDLPKADFGDWQFVEEQPFDDSVAKMLECTGQTARVYLNTKTGARITMFVIVGPHGPTVAHTPDICYSSREYDIHTKRRKKTFKTPDGRRHTFWVMTMKSKSELDPHLLRVWYAWSDGETWSAKEHPRWDYLGAPRLYKIQLAARVDEASGTDPVEEFLKDFLPELAKHME